MGKRKRSAAKDAGGDPGAAPPLPPGVKLVRTLLGHENCIKRIAWSPDGRLLASKGNGRDSTIRLWRSDTGACVAKIPEPPDDDGTRGRLTTMRGCPPGNVR